jgi:hypothetical protein
MSDDVEKAQKELAGPNLRRYFGVYPKNLKQYVNEDSRCLGQVSNMDPPEYQCYRLRQIYS